MTTADHEKIERAIKQSSIRFSLKSMSRDLLNKWHLRAKYFYQFMADVEANDLDVAERDLTDSLALAIRSLLDAPQHKKRIPGWSFGYICGHIQGSIEVKWTDRYIVERSEEYADILKIQTLIELFRVDSSIPKKLEIIYGHYKSKIQRGNTNTMPHADNVFFMASSGELSDNKKQLYKTEFESYFKELLAAQHHSLHETYKASFCPSLYEYLDQKEIQFLVGRENYA